jgi:hypothetical protein
MIELVDPSNVNLPIGKDVKALNSDPNLIEPKRRSHRPRGCRGGRKNRKSQQAKAQALIPREILDDDATPQNSSISNRTLTNVQFMEKPTNGKSIACAGGLPFMSQSYGGTAAFSTSAFGLKNVLDRSEQSPSPPPPPPPPPTTILPPVQSIYEAQAVVGSSFPVHIANDVIPSQQKASFYAASHNNEMRLDSYKPMPCGTLTLNGAASYCNNAAYKLPPRAPLIFSPVKSGGNPAFPLDDYQRLLAQKQATIISPHGGSLFATSPRSFLFGRPGETSSIAW